MIVNTPGVYITEKNTLPSSVAGVSTAVPVFIGFTELGQANPVRIKSMFEFENAFGGGFSPVFTADLDASLTLNDVKPDYRFFLYDSLHLYFRNGGGPCYIISAGEYSTVGSIGDVSSGLDTALTKVDALDEATLLLIPDLHATHFDGTNLNDLGNSYGTIASQAIQKCANLQDKFAIFDYVNMDATDIQARGSLIGTEAKLKYGAVYYPWLRDANAIKVSFDNLNLNIPSGSTLEGDINDINTDLNALVSAYNGYQTAQSLRSEFERLKAAVTPLPNKALFTDVFIHLYGLVDNLNTALNVQSIIDQRNNLSLNQTVVGTIKNLFWFKKVVESSFILSTSSLDTYNTDSKWYNQTGDTYASSTDVESDYANLNYSLPPSPPNPTNADALKELEIRVDLNQLFTAIASLFDFVSQKKQLLENQLFATDSVYNNIQTAVVDYMKAIPSQGAIAGIYCKNDRERGVWKSPANIAIQGIERPLIEISNAEQDSMNKDSQTGKSINVIRTFTGKGALVWGARTLAGNSNEWCYIAVRRFFSYAEESIKKAMAEFVFEPNNARTWVKIKAMVTSFLVEQWKAGALVGTTVDDAFFVRIGEDTTTPAEILNGLINVQIGMAVARPAEFIILEFSHQTK